MPQIAPVMGMILGMDYLDDIQDAMFTLKLFHWQVNSGNISSGVVQVYAGTRSKATYFSVCIEYTCF